MTIKWIFQGCDDPNLFAGRKLCSFTKNNFRLVVASDVISSVVVDLNGTDVHVKFGDSGSNFLRYMNRSKQCSKHSDVKKNFKPSMFFTL